MLKLLIQQMYVLYTVRVYNTCEWGAIFDFKSLKVHKHEIFFTFFAETEPLWC